jgi:hypothetical protein
LGLFFQDEHVSEAALGQVIGSTKAVHTAADDDDLDRLGEHGFTPFNLFLEWAIDCQPTEL